MVENFKLFWLRMFDWQGKTSRREFWLGVLGNALIMLVLLTLLIVSLTCFQNAINLFSLVMIFLFSFFVLIELLPSISLIIRRMHDIGKSGYFIWILFIPIAGFIWYLYLVTRPTDYFLKQS
ncbi:MAG: DUF805 domain-containing protein [Candidatus Caccovivens sp.]